MILQIKIFSAGFSQLTRAKIFFGEPKNSTIRNQQQLKIFELKKEFFNLSKSKTSCLLHVFQESIIFFSQKIYPLRNKLFRFEKWDKQTSQFSAVISKEIEREFKKRKKNLRWSKEEVVICTWKYLRTCVFCKSNATHGYKRTCEYGSRERCMPRNFSVSFGHSPNSCLLCQLTPFSQTHAGKLLLYRVYNGR